jgi:alpha-amylase/alpha-mannosidase (GH57 family)
VTRYVCIHGHFYQPPRENPWLESIELQESAYPFHDWNERITAECYGPNARSRILDEDGAIIGIVNNYASISFNFGPTLLAWMERARPDVYAAVLEADRLSEQRFDGHGSALAQAFNHAILPLCSTRDRITQVRWGIRDFEQRFGRSPRGMWLPETAVDTATLETLADHGIGFTLLAPRQAARIRPSDQKETAWEDVRGGRVDPRRPYVAHLPSGRKISLFFYDGPVSRAVAFEHLLDSGDKLRHRLLGAFDDRPGPQLVHIATDGETYGHHHRFGDMALAYALRAMEDDDGVTLTNYSQYLALHPPQWEVEIAPQTSWSCAHGIERWRADCGCKTGGQPQWSQAWRGPLRVAFDALREELVALFERQAPALFRDPWAARDAYIDVASDRQAANVDALLAAHAREGLTETQVSTALKLLEMQRHAMLMYTSCAWFFDELSGIETVQCIRYAARAIQLAQQIETIDVESPFIERLREAKSNIPEQGDGAKIYEHLVRPARVDFSRVVAHYAVSSLFAAYEDRTTLFAYHIDRLDTHRRSLGRQKLAIGRVRVTSMVTREHRILVYGILHLGDHNLSGGVREFRDEAAYASMHTAVDTAFVRADMPEALRLLDKHFGELTYSLRSLFRDEQHRILDEIVAHAISDAEGVARRVHDAHSPLLRYLATLDVKLPPSLHRLSSFVLNTTLRQELSKRDFNHAKIRTLLDESSAVGTELERVGPGFALQETLERGMAALAEAPDQFGRLRRLRRTTQLAEELPFDIDYSRVQNDYWLMRETVYPRFLYQAERGDAVAAQWCEEFRTLGLALKIRV